ncbi:hypothetical protein QTP70_021373, partial [Hemibagrus guttatus]
TLPFSPFSLCSERPDHRRQDGFCAADGEYGAHSQREFTETKCLSYSPLTSWSSLAWASITRFPFPRLWSHSKFLPKSNKKVQGVGFIVSKGSVSSSVRWPVVTPLKRKGGVESDGPPKKLFVAGVTDPAHITSCTVSVSQSADSPSSTVSICPSPQNIALSLSPPSPFTSQHPSI